MIDNFKEGFICGFGMFFLVIAFMHFVLKLQFGYAGDIEMVISIIIGMIFIGIGLFSRYLNNKENNRQVKND